MVERSRCNTEMSYDEGTGENGRIVTLVFMAVGGCFEIPWSNVRAACY